MGGMGGDPCGGEGGGMGVQRGGQSIETGGGGMHFGQAVARGIARIGDKAALAGVRTVFSGQQPTT